VIDGQALEATIETRVLDCKVFALLPPGHTVNKPRRCPMRCALHCMFIGAGQRTQTKYMSQTIEGGFAIQYELLAPPNPPILRDASGPGHSPFSSYANMAVVELADFTGLDDFPRTSARRSSRGAVCGRGA
jgi:hypothetical protein